VQHRARQLQKSSPRAFRESCCRRLWRKWQSTAATTLLNWRSVSRTCTSRRHTDTHIDTLSLSHACTHTHMHIHTYGVCNANGSQPRRQRCSTCAACHEHVRHTDTQTRTQRHTFTHMHAYRRTYPHEVCSANGSQPRRQRCSASAACHCGTQTHRHAHRLTLSHTRMHYTHMDSVTQIEVNHSDNAVELTQRVTDLYATQTQ